MLEGLMQHDHPLTLQLILERMRRVYGDSEVIGMRDGERAAISYAALAERADRLCRGLEQLGVRPGDRVATFAWNTPEHLEAYLAVPCMGAVLHTVNVRLFADQVAYVVNHAQDGVVLVDDSLVPVLQELAPRFETVRHYVVMGAGDCGSLPNAIPYEELLAAQEPGYAYPPLDDRQAAGLCYTSGTTGNPKGVLYSHRSNILHALGQCMADSIGVVELENEIMAHPAVKEAAVIACPDERWGERPLACVVTEEGEALTLEGLREHLTSHVAKWWLPDALAILDEVPKTSVGKFDKKVLRRELEEGRLERLEPAPG